MPRIVQDDFLRLQSFLASYAISPGLGSEVREALLKRGHKALLAALQLHAVFELLASQKKLRLAGVDLADGDLSFLLVRETFADLVSAFFAGIHGLYRPAQMSLRSAIENFVRGLAGMTSTSALSTTSVYQLFEIAKGQTAFGFDNANILGKLQMQYGELCLYSHTATINHMSGNVALATFPKVDTKQFRMVVQRLDSLIKLFLTVLIEANSALYLKIHVRGRDLLDETIAASVRVRALGG